MAIYKNDNGTWYVMIRYQDWTGARKQKCKRGFSTRKEAADWELQFKLQKKASVDMTKNSVRTVIMPQFLCDEMQDCLKLYYSLKSDDRIFPVTKYYLKHEMERGCKASGVKKIRVHDLRHSHVSLLINMGYTALAIGKRVGHSAEKITYRYAHLFPSVQQDMAEQLDAENMEEELNEVEGGLANVG